MLLSPTVQIFQRPLQDPEQVRPLIALKSVERIFNPLSEIEAAHREMSNELSEAISNWNEKKTCVGDVLIKYVSPVCVRVCVCARVCTQSCLFNYASTYVLLAFMFFLFADIRVYSLFGF